MLGLSPSVVGARNEGLHVGITFGVEVTSASTEVSVDGMAVMERSLYTEGIADEESVDIVVGGKDGTIFEMTVVTPVGSAVGVAVAKAVGWAVNAVRTLVGGDVGVAVAKEVGWAVTAALGTMIGMPVVTSLG